MTRLFGLVSNISLATATATTNAVPGGTGIVQIGMGGRLKGAILLAGTTGVAPQRGTINLYSQISGGIIGVVLISGWFRGYGSASGGDVAEADSLSWTGDMPVSDKNPSYLYFGIRNDTGATIVSTYGWVQEYEK